MDSINDYFDTFDLSTEIENNTNASNIGNLCECGGELIESHSRVVCNTCWSVICDGVINKSLIVNNSDISNTDQFGSSISHDILDSSNAITRVRASKKFDSKRNAIIKKTIQWQNSNNRDKIKREHYDCIMRYLSKIKRISFDEGLKDIIAHECARNFEIINNCQNFRNHNRRGLLVACVYHILHKQKHAVIVDELARYFSDYKVQKKNIITAISCIGQVILAMRKQFGDARCARVEVAKGVYITKNDINNVIDMMQYRPIFATDYLQLKFMQLGINDDCDRELIRKVVSAISKKTKKDHYYLLPIIFSIVNDERALDASYTENDVFDVFMYTDKNEINYFRHKKMIEQQVRGIINKL